MKIMIQVAGDMSPEQKAEMDAMVQTFAKTVAQKFDSEIAAETSVESDDTGLIDWTPNPLPVDSGDPLAILKHESGEISQLMVAFGIANKCNLPEGKHLVITKGAGKFELKEIGDRLFIIQKPKA